jgi:hypothetical protein
MLLVKLTDDELSELRQEYAGQLRLVAEEQDRRTLARRARPTCANCGGRGECDACGSSGVSS